ncbi:MAG: SurA N-terminal domain-containing protein [Myxococcales bacterium]|nr:SurA N-terminal domain-containing protein [Myxococcales bacterium]
MIGKRAALLLAPFALLLWRPQLASAEIIERVVAVVNDEAILLSDLRRRAAPFLEQAIAGAASDLDRSGRIKSLYRQLLEQLVDEELVEQEARSMQITVGSPEVDQAIDNVRQQNSLDEEQFWQAVEGQGFNRQQYRADVRKQLLRLKVINQRVRSRVQITENAIRETYDERARKARRSQRFHAAHIFEPLPETASATDVAAALSRARALRAKLNAENFDSHAESQGGDLGWLDQGDLSSVLEEELVKLTAGEISPPVRSPAGVHILLLKERAASDTKLPTYEEARGAIHRELLDKAMRRQEELFMTGLRREAVVERRE